jgi:hypothetical protein
MALPMTSISPLLKLPRRGVMLLPGIHHIIADWHVGWLAAPMKLGPLVRYFLHKSLAIH